MKLNARRRTPVAGLGLLACLQFGLLICLQFSGGRAAETPTMAGPTQVAQTQSGVTVSPTSVDAGATARLVIAAHGTVDLSGIAASQIGVKPDDGIANIKILSQSAQQLTLSLDVAETVAQGVRTLFIDNAQGAEIVALDLQVAVPAGLCVPHCVPPAQCENNACVSPPCDGVSCGAGNKCCGDTPEVGEHVCVKTNEKCPNPH
jgi:hypothetical protein